MTRTACSVFLALVCLDMATVHAQFVGRVGGVHRGVGVSPFAYGAGYRRGYGYGGYGYGSAAGSELQGLSSVIRETSNARVQFEEAHSKYIDNKAKWQTTYYSMMDKHQQRVEAQNAKEGEIRDKYLAKHVSGAPARLSASQLDYSTGHVAWPEALLSDSFEPNRKRIEQLFQLRAQTSQGSHSSKEIRSEADQMMMTLKGQINELPANEYISARKFLDSLSYETQFASR